MRWNVSNYILIVLNLSFCGRLLLPIFYNDIHKGSYLLYAPTQDHDDENIEEFYEQIQLVVSYTKSSDIIGIMGDLNAKVGNVTDFNIIGNYGLGKQNERGQRLIEFFNENNMVIMNTWF